MLKWLKKNGCPCDEFTLLAAVKNGNLENMIWLEGIAGCSWNIKFTFSTAAEHGSLGNMKWLLKNGCPWDEYTFSAAAEHEKFEIMNWLLKKGCPIPTTICVFTIKPWMKVNGYGVTFVEYN